MILPDGNGKELHEGLSADAGISRVLYMSGYPKEAIDHHDLLEPGVRYIQKPFSITLFTKKVREVLQG